MAKSTVLSSQCPWHVPCNLLEQRQRARRSPPTPFSLPFLFLPRAKVLPRFTTLAKETAPAGGFRSRALFWAQTLGRCGFVSAAFAAAWAAQHSWTQPRPKPPRRPPTLPRFALSARARVSALVALADVRGTQRGVIATALGVREALPKRQQSARGGRVLRSDLDWPHHTPDRSARAVLRALPRKQFRTTAEPTNAKDPRPLLLGRGAIPQTPSCNPEVLGG